MSRSAAHGHEALPATEALHSVNLPHTFPGVGHLHLCLQVSQSPHSPSGRDLCKCSPSIQPPSLQAPTQASGPGTAPNLSAGTPQVGPGPQWKGHCPMLSEHLAGSSSSKVEESSMSFDPESPDGKEKEVAALPILPDSPFPVPSCPGPVLPIDTYKAAKKPNSWMPA